MEPDEEPVLCPIAMGGDQLTIARSRTAQEVRVTDKSSKQALRGTMETGMLELTFWRYIY